VEGELGQLVGAQHDDGEEGGGFSKGGLTPIRTRRSSCEADRRGFPAIAIGNSHGAYKFKGTQHLNLERLKAIKQALLNAGLGDYRWSSTAPPACPRTSSSRSTKYGGKLGEDAAGGAPKRTSKSPAAPVAPR